MAEAMRAISAVSPRNCPERMKQTIAPTAAAATMMYFNKFFSWLSVSAHALPNTLPVPHGTRGGVCPV